MKSAGTTSGAAPASGVNPVRFMQIALLTTVCFSVIYMGEFISNSVRTIEANNGAVVVAAPADMAEPAAFAAGGGVRGGKVDIQGATQILLQGFDAAYKYVSEYDVETQGPLYLLFMADVDENGEYWCPDCRKAKKPVYDVFARAPRGSRLAEIRIGPVDDWNDDNNPFKQNELFYIDYIPSLIRYDGHGNSSNMLNEQYALDYDLLEYAFNVPYPAAGTPNKNSIITMDDTAAITDYVLKYDNSYPLFIYFVSGYHSFNGRLWCPYCDRANLGVLHYYNYSAPDGAVLLRAIVSHSYKMWKKKRNPFKQPEFRQTVASIHGVPFLARVVKDEATNKVVINEYRNDFYEKDKLVPFFQDKAP